MIETNIAPTGTGAEVLLAQRCQAPSILNVNPPDSPLALLTV